MIAAALMHCDSGNGTGIFLLTINGETIYEGGSSVRVLRALRKAGLAIPDIMTGPACWDADYNLRFDNHTELWMAK